jgi:hypothetical protein
LSICADRLVYDDYRDDITFGAFLLSFSDDRLVYDDYRDDITFGALKTPFGSLVFQLFVRVIDVMIFGQCFYYPFVLID